MAKDTGISEFEALKDGPEKPPSDDSWRGGGYRIDPDPALTPAKLTLKGTSTTNPARPRTVAAGYDPKTQVMTVVFYDGTWWNYYDVPPDMWDEFEAAESKGQYLRESGLDTWDSMGPANMGQLTPSQRVMLNWVARQSRMLQEKSGGMQGYGDPRSKQFTR